MKPLIHSRLSSRKYGGTPEEYMKYHNWMDQTKGYLADVRHRAILHSAFGCMLIEQVFGDTFINSEGKEISTRDIAEDHILEDLGQIPTLEKWLSKLPLESWMGKPNEDAAKGKEPRVVVYESTNKLLEGA